MLSHRVRNGCVEAPIQDVEFVRCDWRILVDRQLGDRLADVPVVVHDLRHGETQAEQVSSMARRAVTNGVRRKWCLRVLPAKRLDQLGEEHWQSVFQFGGGRW